MPCSTSGPPIVVNHVPLPPNCPAPIICFMQTAGEPQNVPVVGDPLIQYDPCSGQFWFFTCLAGWQKNALDLCSLEPLTPSIINNICSRLQIPAFYDENGCCSQGSLSLQDLSEQIAACLGFPPTAGISVAAGQDITQVNVVLTGNSHPFCPTPGLVSAVWQLFDNSNNLIASGTDLPGTIVLPNLNSFVGPFRMTYQVTDLCGMSNVVTTVFGTQQEFGPTCVISVASGQPENNTLAVLGGASSPTCLTPGIISAVWQLFDGANVMIGNGTDLPGTIVLPNLAGFTGPFRLTYTVTDACGTSGLCQTIFTLLAQFGPIAHAHVADQQIDTAVVFYLYGTSDPSCPNPGISSAAWEIRDALNAIVASGTDLPGIYSRNLSAFTGPFEIRYTVTDSCGTSPQWSANFTAGTIDCVGPGEFIMPPSGSCTTNPLVCSGATAVKLCDGQYGFVMPPGNSFAAFSFDHDDLFSGGNNVFINPVTANFTFDPNNYITLTGARIRTNNPGLLYASGQIGSGGASNNWLIGEIRFFDQFNVQFAGLANPNPEYISDTAGNNTHVAISAFRMQPNWYLRFTGRDQTPPGSTISVSEGNLIFILGT